MHFSALIPVYTACFLGTLTVLTESSACPYQGWIFFRLGMLKEV